MDDLDRLRDVLQGDLVTPGSPDYEAARRPAFARHGGVRPRAVVRCASVRDVVQTITYARDSGTPLVPRGGGHCFAGRSTTEGVVLDLGSLSAVAVAPDGRARIGAGARLAQVYGALDAHRRAVPAGCGPTVGIAGLTLGGGLGLLGRRYGLTSDALTAAEVVLADGRVVRCDADREPELFWALRGSGGGQFGVVTALEFATVPEPRVTRVELRWAGDAAAVVAGVVAAWQDWAPRAAAEITVNLSVAAEPGRPLEVTAFGAALCDRDGTAALLDGLVSRVDALPDVRLRDDLTVCGLKRSFAPAGEPTALTTRSRSELFARPLPPSTVTALLDDLCAGPLKGRRELAFTALGGAYDEFAPDATAYAHRGARFLLEHVGEDGSEWVDRSWALAHAHGTGRVYANFPDVHLEDWASAYHGDHHARLVAAKRAYDPDRLFDFPQAI
ncbi:MAG: FAD-binding oxidoreductase [Actinophytocola sp.]|uniref:FAD-binding oxidoreductase n=1 Tax=Actinophytocola sp. TaxID=1872138 RepID=UPI003D6BFB1B